MVLDDIAQHARFFPEAASCADADLFADGELHMVDMVVVPERFEDRVAEAEDHEILHRLFA